MHYALRNGIRTDRSRWISFRRASRFLSFAIITLYPFGSIDRSIPPLSRNLFLLLFLRHFCLFLHIYIYIYFRFFESIGQSGKGWSENRGSLFFYKRNVKKRISKSLFILIAENCRFEWHVERTGGKLRAGIRIATFH